MSKRKHRKIKRRSLRVNVAPPKTLLQPTTMYWAYGSNLNKKQMKIRCPRAKPVGPLYLRNGLLTFRYYADVEQKDGEDYVIAGGLWRITRKCEEELDLYEGVANQVYEKRYLLLSVKGKPEKCLYYRMLGEGIMPPDPNYFETIQEGYKDFGLDEKLLEAALERSWEEKDRSPEVMRRWNRRGRRRLARIAEASNETVQ
jgi:hypothetical protein